MPVLVDFSLPQYKMTKYEYYSLGQLHLELFKLWCATSSVHSVTNIRIFEYIWIFSATNIRSYRNKISYSSHYASMTNIRIFEYIRIFSATNIRSYHIRILFLIRIYSDIRSYCFFNTNIFGYSFVSKFHIRHTMLPTSNAHTLTWKSAANKYKVSAGEECQLRLTESCQLWSLSQHLLPLGEVEGRNVSQWKILSVNVQPDRSPIPGWAGGLFSAKMEMEKLVFGFKALTREYLFVWSSLEALPPWLVLGLVTSFLRSVELPSQEWLQMPSIAGFDVAQWTTLLWRWETDRFAGVWFFTRILLADSESRSSEAPLLPLLSTHLLPRMAFSLATTS